MRARCALALALVFHGAGCKREPEVVAARATAPAAARVTARVPARDSAFDLIASDGGALLVWARSRVPAGGGVYVQALTARGQTEGEPRRLAQTDAGGEVMELEAVAVGQQIGLAWVESTDRESRTRALLVRPDEPSPPEPTRVATGAAVHTATRARLAVVDSGAGRLRVLYADTETECAEHESGPCVSYGFREVGEGARESGRPWLAVPEPCPGGVPSMLVRGDRLYYAVCATRAGTPATVAYSISVRDEYARADEVLRGCELLGMLGLAKGALVIGDCGGVRRGAELTLADQPAVERELGERSVACTGDRLVLRAGSFELALQGARDRVESLLPDALAPTGARAVWTGRALLVAHPSPDGIELVATACEGGVMKTVR